MFLKGRTALITGAMGGIGLAIARALGAEGCHLVLNDLPETGDHESTCEKLAAELSVDVSYDPADLSDRAQVEQLASRAAGRSGAVDVLVNNAVKRHYHSLSEFPPEEWDYALRVNLTAPFDLCRLTLAAMRARGWGRIVNISSVLGLGGKSGRVDYVTTKTALLGLTRSVAAETLTDPQVTCNAICPGSVLTPFIRDRIQGLADERNLTWDEMAVRYRAELNQAADFISPEQIGAAVLFLCRDEAASINGAAVPVDGGLSGAFMQGPGS